MSTVAQQVLAAALQVGIVLGALSCSSAPEAPAPVQPQQAIEAPPAMPGPAPLGEVEPARDTAPAPQPEPRLAVIHARPAPQPAPVDRLPELAPLRRDAQRAEHECRFDEAEQLFRELRDHALTPRAMRSHFHAHVEGNAAVRYGLLQIRHALDRRDFATAAERHARLAGRFPDVPFAALLGCDKVRMPRGDAVPGPDPRW